MPLNSLMPELRLFLLVPYHPDHQAGMIQSPPSRAYLAPRRLWLQVCHGLEGGLGMWSAWAYVCLQICCKHPPASPKVLLRMDVGSLAGKDLGEGNWQEWNWARVGDQPATTCSTEKLYPVLLLAGWQEEQLQIRRAEEKLSTEITLAQLLLLLEFTLLYLIFLPWEDHY